MSTTAFAAETTQHGHAPAPLVRDWMTAPVIVVTPQTSLFNARRLLELHGIRHLPVVEGNAVVGMISDRNVRLLDSDLAVSLSALRSDLWLGRYRAVSSVMVSPAHVAFPDDDVVRVARFMVTRRISAMPVVDHGRLVGLISMTDCVRALVSALDEGYELDTAEVDRP